MSPPIYHVSLVSEWRAARGAGEYTMSSNGVTLAQQGFIHCCYVNQIQDVLQRFYADVTEPMCMLAIDPDRVQAPVIAENLEGGAELFPHIYGPIPISAVTEVTMLTRDEFTGWRFRRG
jgi:uncharacterized protein (DUF952 family)